MSKNVIPINRSFSLYGIFCPISEELRYIGITTGSLDNRLRGHLTKPTNGKIGYWFKSLEKNCYKPNIKLIKECVSYEELLNEEIKEIKKYRDLNLDLFNIADGGDINPMYGKTHSKEAREKISKTQKGRVRTIEERKHMSDVMKGKWTKWNGGKLPEWSDKMREVMRRVMREKMKGNHYAKGYKHTDETKELFSKQRIGNSYAKGYKHTDETKKLFSAERTGKGNNMFGKKLSIESINKRNLTIEINKTFKGKNNPNYKYNINVDDLKRMYLTENKSKFEISTIYNCSEANINRLLKINNIKKESISKYNYEDLYKLYIIDNLTQYEIGEIYNTNNKYISKILKKYKIKR